MAGDGDSADQEIGEADTYELLKPEDIDSDPSDFRPIGPGDVFSEIALNHLATPLHGPVIVVGHPCSLRRGLDLQDDLPVAPIVEPGIPTRQHPIADRVLPVAKLLPPGSDRNRVIQLTLTTTVPAITLDPGQRCASLNRAGVVALQQLSSLSSPGGAMNPGCGAAKDVDREAGGDSAMDSGWLSCWWHQR